MVTEISEEPVEAIAFLRSFGYVTAQKTTASHRFHSSLNSGAQWNECLGKACRMGGPDETSILEVNGARERLEGLLSLRNLCVLVLTYWN